MSLLLHRGRECFFPFCAQNDLQLPQKAVFVTSHHQGGGIDEGKLRKEEPGGLKEVI